MSRRWWIVSGLALGGVLCFLLYPLVQRTSEDWGYQRSRFSLGQIALALHSYDATFGRLPPGVIRDKDGRSLYSWRGERGDVT